MRLLYVQPGPGVGGSKISLRTILQCAPEDQVSQVALTLPPHAEYEKRLSGLVEKIHYLELPTWNKYRRDRWLEKLKTPFSHVRRLISLFPSASRLATIIREENIDLVHTNNSISAAGAIAAYFTDVPHIWHVRESIGMDSEYPLIVGDRMSGSLFRGLSQMIICNSSYTANFFYERNIPVRVIGNGVDFHYFQSSRAKEKGSRLRYSLIGDLSGPVVAMIGNLTTRLKGHIFFLEVTAKLRTLFPESCFVIFGGNSDLDTTPYTRELKLASDQLSVHDCLVWVDFIDDIPAIMHSMDILVHPASKEGSGRVVMEAMAAGRAVVGVRSGGVQELIQDGVTGFLVPPGDVDAMADRVRFLLENPQERLAMGSRAAEFASQNFSNQVMMNSITEIYKEMVRV